MQKILLINPAYRTHLLDKVRVLALPPLNLQMIAAYREVASCKRSLPRGLKTLWRTRSLFSTGIAFFWNYDSYKSIRTLTRPQFKS